jgi:hypothetical protein
MSHLGIGRRHRRQHPLGRRHCRQHPGHPPPAPGPPRRQLLRHIFQSVPGPSAPIGASTTCTPSGHSFSLCQGLRHPSAPPPTRLRHLPRRRLQLLPRPMPPWSPSAPPRRHLGPSSPPSAPPRRHLGSSSRTSPPRSTSILLTSSLHLCLCQGLRQPSAPLPTRLRHLKHLPCRRLLLLRRPSGPVSVRPLDSQTPTITGQSSASRKFFVSRTSRRGEY